MYSITKNMKKLINDVNGFSFLYEIPETHQQIYQKTNETAFFILKNIVQSYNEDYIIDLLKSKYKKDIFIDDKVNNFIQNLKSWNIIIDSNEVQFNESYRKLFYVSRT